ncbi:MAG: AarF/UbiB family protein [Myxococcota bacterium]
MWAAIRLIRATWVFGWIFASYMLQMGLERLFGRQRLRPRWKKVHRRNARRMYRGFVSLRGVYIKLGQILSIMGNFLPRAYGEELEALQDEVPAQPYDKMAKSFARSFGKLPTEAFREFTREPIAAASLGQVHEAIGRDGEHLAVKILYPNVATIIKIDLRVLGWALKVYRWFVPVRQIERVHEQLRDMLQRETDLAHEADCLERMAGNFTDDPDVLFPEVYREFTSRTVLTMSFMDGVKITRVSELDELGLDPVAVATKLVKVFYKQLFIDRFFHADPHPGNFFVQRGPEGQVRLVILDFGSSSEVTDSLADGMIDILSGLMTRNDDLVVRGIETMGFVAADGDRELLERTTRKYFEKLLELNITDMSKVSADVATHIATTDERRQELRELMKSVEYPVGWFYVERAVVIMFALSLQLAPKLNTLQVGFPYIMQFMTERRLGQARAKAEKARTEAKQTEPVPASSGVEPEAVAQPESASP